MDRDYWLERWKKNEIGFHRSEINPYLVTYFRELNLRPGDHIFVPLCGKSLDMLWLLQQGYKVTGVELSTIACQNFFTENNLTYKLHKVDNFQQYFHNDQLQILCGDFFDLEPEKLMVNAIYDRAALIALPPSLRERYAKKLTRNLKFIF